MFTLQQLKAAHGRVKSGADFPRYIREIKQLGLITYEFSVKDGAIIYYGKDQQVKADPIYEPLEINPVPSVKYLQHTIAIHQQGKTDFLTFCNQAAKAGVEKWVIDTQKMLCLYQDQDGNSMIAEPIPGEDYS